MSGDETAVTELRERKDRRSLVLLAAKLRTPQGLLDVRLRNLSISGALLEAEYPPAKGLRVVFERGDTIVPARIAWSGGNRFGIQFDTPIEESELLADLTPAAARADVRTLFVAPEWRDQVLVHVSRPKQGAQPPAPAIFKRPGLRTTANSEERLPGDSWAHAPWRSRFGE